MKAAILGAGGFIGYRLTEYLLLAGLSEPRPVVRSFRSMARVSRFALDTRMADACDATALSSALQGCEVAFHCIVGDRTTILESLAATYAACRRAGVRRLVYLSSAVVHGHQFPEGCIETSAMPEDQPFEYNVSKIMAERSLRSLMADGIVETTIFRPAVVFGPRSTWWTAQIATDILAKKAYFIDGGRGAANTIYVDNLVHALWLGATVPAAKGEDFLVRDPEVTTWFDLYKSVADAVGVPIEDVWQISSPSLQINIESREFLKDFLRNAQKNRFAKAFKELVRSPQASWLSRKIRSSLSGTPRQVAEVQTDKNPNAPTPDLEIASMQMCRNAICMEKAVRILGYHPPVTFAEASKRTACWLRFALGAGE